MLWRLFSTMRFLDGEGGGGGGGAAADDLQKKLQDAEAARKKAEADLQAQKSAEEKLRKEKEDKDLLEKGNYEELKRRAEAERQKLEAERRDGAIQLALELQAARAGLKSPEYLKLIDRSGITYKDGQVEGADKVFADFKKAHAELFGEAKEEDGASGGSGRAPKAGGQPSNLVEEMLKEAQKTRQPRYPRGWKKD